MIASRLDGSIANGNFNGGVMSGLFFFVLPSGNNNEDKYQCRDDKEVSEYFNDHLYFLLFFVLLQHGAVIAEPLAATGSDALLS